MLKDPNATLPYTVDWTAWLANEGDTALSATWTVPTGLTESIDPRHGRTLDAGKATIWLSGGTEGQTYLVTCHLITAGGREDDRTLPVRIRNR